MEVPDVGDADSILNLFRELGKVYTENETADRHSVWCNVLAKGRLEDEDKVSWREDYANYCYNLRYRGFYDDTNELEDLVTELEEEPLCGNMMKFITLLSGSVPHPTGRTGFIPSISQHSADHHIFPEVRCHGDTRTESGIEYSMYRDALFEGVQTCSTMDVQQKEVEAFPQSNSLLSRFIRPSPQQLALASASTPLAICPPSSTLPALPDSLGSSLASLPPGLGSTPGEAPSGFFRPRTACIVGDLPPLPPPNEASIFQSLVAGPESLPTLCRGPRLQTDVRQRYQVVARGAGVRFAPVRQQLTDHSVSSGIASDEEDVWEEAYRLMTVELPDPTYESHGRKTLQEKPYLSEAGPVVYTRLCNWLSSPFMDSIQMVTDKHVLYHCQFVLVGIPTSIFIYDKVKVEFVLQKNYCFTGVSPDSLGDTLFSIAYTGTLYLRLKMFCEQYSATERYGNTVKGLVSGVETFLNSYQTFLLAMKVDSLLELVWNMKPLTRELEFLCNLLLLEEGLETGTELIEYLVGTAEVLVFSSHYKLLLHLLQSALTPYAKFLEQWLCWGRVWDEWEEYHVTQHPEWANNRDYLFWQYAYTDREQVQLPGFLSDLEEQLLNTGRLINMFHHCVPDHPLNSSKVQPPQLQITFDHNGIEQSHEKWQQYKESIESELRARTAEQEMKRKEEKDARIKVLSAAKEDTRRRMARIMEEARVLRNASSANAKAELERLQLQMLDRAEERVALLEAEKKEDKERIEQQQKHQYQLVEEVRAKLEEYYSSLSQEKAREQRRSLWRIQRMKLNRLRRAHLLLETQSLNLEMRRRLATGGIGDQAGNQGIHGLGGQAIESKSGDQDGNQGENQGDEESAEHAVLNHVLKEVMPGGMLVDDEEEVTGRDSIDISITIDLNNSLNPEVDETLSQPQPKSTEDNADPAVEVSKDDAGAYNGVASESEDSEISFTVSPGQPEPSQKQFEPDGQMVDLLYGDGVAKAETEVKSNRKFEPDGEMVGLLYGGDEGTTDENIPQQQFEPDNEVARLLYGAETENNNLQPRSSVKIVAQAEGQMAELLQGGGSDSNQPKSVSITDQPDSEVANLIYGNSGDHTEKGLPGSEKSATRAPEEGPNSDHGAYEPEGQMKGLLYGDGKSTAPRVSNENVTNENMRTVDTRQRGDTGGRMKSLLYGSKEDSGAKIVEDTNNQIIPATFSDMSSDSGVFLDSVPDPLRMEYPELEEEPDPLIISKRLTKFTIPENGNQTDSVDRHRALSISLQRLILQPLLLQSNLVNKAAVQYFIKELKINNCFAALRDYLCMNNGMFGDSLSKGIYNMIEGGIDITCAPAKLNSVLQEAMESSTTNERLSLESVGPRGSMEALDCLALRYKVDWPSNIIVTDSSLHMYNMVFKLLLKLKQGCFTLDKVWNVLRSVERRSGSSPQIRRLQLYRYEVSQFLDAVQIYMTHQLHNISWHELQKRLGEVTSVSSLQEAHTTYLHNALERLFLGESTKAPYQIIIKISKHVSSFLRVLESEGFVTDKETGELVHGQFEKLIQRHNDFKKQAQFILKIAESCNIAGCKPYIEEFMCRVDFNNFYQSTSSTNRASLYLRRDESLGGLSSSSTVRSPLTPTASSSPYL